MCCSRLAKFFVVFAVVLWTCGDRPATATVIFEEDFSLRPLNTSVFGTAPNITNTNAATFVRGGELGQGTEGLIGQYGNNLGITGLLFQPKNEFGQPLGGPNQNMALHYDYAFGTDKIRLTMVARQEQPRWTNFVFGTTDNSAIIRDMVLLQTPAGLANTTAQVFHQGIQNNTTITPAVNSSFFRTLVLEYDPTLVNTPGVNPYSLTSMVSSIPLP